MKIEFIQIDLPFFQIKCVVNNKLKKLHFISPIKQKRLFILVLNVNLPKIRVTKIKKSSCYKQQKLFYYQHLQYQGQHPIRCQCSDVNSPFNFFVPIINKADAYIDYYQIQAYNNWYDYYAPGRADYLIDVYLNWRNFPGLAGTQPLTDFKGVSGSKILMGVIGSQSAGGPGFYTTPQNIQKFKQYLVANGYPIKGFMIWDSYWDSLNQYTISNAVKKSASSI